MNQNDLRLYYNIQTFILDYLTNILYKTVLRTTLKYCHFFIHIYTNKKIKIIIDILQDVYICLYIKVMNDI